MKTINALLLFVLILAVNSELSGFDHQSCKDHAPSALISGGGNKPAFSLDFCRSTDNSDHYRCCFLKYEKDNQRQYYCMPLTNNEFWDIDKTIESFESKLGVDVDSLDCSSSYLYVSLLLIFALLF